MTRYRLLFLLCLSFPAFLLAQNVNVTTITPEFPASGGVKLGPDGRLYIANFGDALGNANGTQVWRMDTIDAFSTPQLFVSNGLAGASGNDFNSQGTLFQSNIAGNRISQIPSIGGVSTFTTNGISNPVGIAIDADDTLFVCNCGNGTIQKVSPSGQSIPFASDPMLQCPNGGIIDHHGNLYVSNFSNGNVIKITRDGTPSIFATIPGANNGHLTFYAPDSVFYVASHGSSSLYRVSMLGDVILVAGTGVRGNLDGPGTQATFSRPNGMAISATGDTLWVNTSIPTMDGPNFQPLNPSIVRMVTGLNSLPTSMAPPAPVYADRVEIAHFPQPAREELTVRIKLPESQAVELAVFGLNGKRWMTIEKRMLAAGGAEVEIPVGNLAAGVYMLRVGSERFERSVRFVVE